MSTRTALALSFLDRYASLAIGIASSMILARLLTPAEVGVFSVTMALLAFAGAFRDLGAGQYLVQEKELTAEHVRATWTVQLVAGMSLACCVALASAPVAGFYAEPRIGPIMLVAAATYALNPFGSITYAWLMREMRFGALALIRLAGTLSAAGVSVFLAWRGHGPMSLALGALAAAVATAALATLYRPRWFPWIPGGSKVRVALAFGTRITSTSLINTLVAGTPELLLGKLHGMAAAGLYSRANGVIAMFYRLVADPVLPVSMALFAKERRESGAFEVSFLRATAYATALAWAFCMMAALLAHPIMRVLYGPQWDSAVDPMRVLAGGTAIIAPTMLSSAALLACGHAKIVLRATIASALQTLALLGIGATQGLLMLAAAALVAGMVHVCIWLPPTRRAVGFTWTQFTSVLAKSAVVALSSAVAPLFVFMAFGARPDSSAWSLFLGICGSTIGFVLAVGVTRHPLREEMTRLATRLKAGPNT